MAIRAKRRKSPKLQWVQNRRRLLRIELLETRHLLYGPYEVEPNNTSSSAIDLAPLVANPAPEFVSLFGAGAITANDQDFWRFTALAGDRIAVSVDTPDKILNPLVELQNSAGGVLASDDNGGPSNDSLTTFVIVSSGSYFVRVKGNNTTTNGDYQLRVDVARGIDQETDSNYSNNTTGGANALTLTNLGNTRTASVAGSIMGSEGSTRDTDRFQLGLLNAGTQVDLTTRLPQWSTLAPLLEVVDSSGVVVTDTNPDDAIFSGTIIADGTYFASVRTTKAILNGSLYTYNATNQTWTVAEAAAVTAGGHLVSVNSAQEQQFLVDTFGENTYWIGLNDATTEGTFQWSTGEPFSYQNWNGGTPTSASNTASNDYVYFGSTGGRWFVTPSTTTLPSVSEKPAPAGSPSLVGAGPLAQYVLGVTISDLIPPSVASITRLPAQAGSTTDLISSFSLTTSEDYAPATVNHPLTAQYNGRTYLLTNNTMTLAQAETLASSLGGHVTSINNASEQDFLDRTFGFTNFWIGLNDRTTEGTHVWSNADPVTYTNWATGEPNTTSFDAVFFSSNSASSGGKWFDSSETSTFQAVIEIVTPSSDSDGDGLTATFDPFPSDAFNGFDLRAAGTDGVFDTADDQVYMLQVTQTSSRVLSFVVQDGPLGAGSYRFTMTPTLTDILGNPLDGNANGVGGDALVRTFTITAPVPGLFEGKGNRDFSTAVPLPLIQDPLGTGLLRSESIGYGSIDASGDLDYFKFSAQAGDIVAINVDPLVATVPNVFLYDALGNNIASNGRSGPGNTAFISGLALTTTGDYYIRIQSGAGNYQVRVDLARGVPMETDYDYSNDSTGGANSLTLTNLGNTRTASVAGTIMASEDSNRDEDRFQLGLLNAGTQVDLTTRLPQWSTLAPLLEVVDSSGVVVTDTNPDDAIFSGTIIADGTYFASVRTTKAILNGSLYTYNATNQTWTVAEAAAVTAGGHLVSVNSAQEQQLLVDTFGENTYWIGLNDATTEGTFQWSTGEPFSYQNWNGGTPTSASNTASNDYVYFGSTGGRWFVTPSTTTLPSVSEKPAPAGSPSLVGAGPLAQYVLGVTISDLIPPSVASITRLPAQAGSTTDLISSFSLTTSEDYAPATVNHPLTAQYNGRTYLLTNNTMTLAQAETLASSLGGHVTSINNASEQDFLDRTFGFTNFWIGLNDRTTEGTHVWSNADPVTYTNWATGEPNTTSFDAVFFSSNSASSGGKWFDSSETSTFQAVIEIVTPSSDSDGDGLTATFDPFPSDAFNGFDLRAAGTDGVFDTADDQVYMLQVTQTSSRVLSFVVQDGPLGAGSYRFTMTPTLTDILGNPLDGNANGVGGDALVRTFTITAPVPGLFEGKGNRDFSTAVPLPLIQDPLGTGLLRSESIGYGSIDASGDLDYFKFSAQAGDIVAINVDPLVATVPNVFLYDALGNNIASNGRSGPGNTAFISGLALTTTGDYYIRIQSGAGNYQVRVDLARGVPMETDYDYSNDSTGGANSLTLTNLGNTRTASVAGTIMASEDSNRDEDRFQLGLLNAGTQVDLTTRLPQWSTLAPLLEVVDSSGVVVTDTNPDDAIFSGTIIADGTYFASVRTTKAILNGSLYTYNATNQTWTVAEAAAVTAGGHLVSVNSAQEQQFLVDTFGENTYWIGLNDATTEGTFQWSTGEPFSYQNWNGGTPTSASNTASNDYVYFGSTGGRWFVTPSTTTLPSVSEKPAPAGSPSLVGAGPLAQYVLGVTISDLIPPSVASITRLPAQAGSTTDLISSFSLTTSEDYAPATVNHPLTAQYNGRTYLLTNNTMTLAQAETLASSLGGHVTSINNASEQDFLDRTFGFTNFWIGLNDRTTEGTHVWSNADPVTYTNWATGEPNTTSFDAVFFSSNSASSGGKWFDSSETSTFQAVIEIVTPSSDSDGDGLTASFDPFQSDKFNGFDLRAAGTDGVFDTADDQVYMLQVTQTSSRVLSFVVQDGPIAAGSYRFTVTPTLTDILGNPLDGNANGVGGDALVRNFTVSAPVPGLFEGKGNRDFSTAVPLNLIQDPLGTGLLRSENNGYGSIDASGDLDYFKFSAQAGDVVAINVDPLVATVPNVFLYDALGNNIASNGRSGPGNTAFISGFALTITGDYYIRIDSGSGNYQVRVDLARGVPMETDANYSNDTTGGANSLTLTNLGNTRTASVAGSIMGSEGSTRDTDRFQLGLLNAGTQVDLTTRLPQWSTLAPLLEVVDSSGVVVTDTNPDDAIFSGTIIADGTYFASVRTTRAILNGSLYTYNATSQTWTVAEAAAVTAGGHLVSVNSAQEQQLLVDTFGENTYWIGLSDATTEGTFQWSTGEPFSYQNWNGGTPTSASNTASNDYVYFGSTGGRWFVSTSSTTLPSVSEKPAPAGSPSLVGAGPLAQYVLGVTISDLIPPSVASITRLPAQAGSTTDLISSFSLTTSEDYAPATVNHPLTAQYNGRTYLLTNNTMTLAQAETLASSLGGHVTSINNASEQDFLDRTFGFTNFWIGLNDRTTEGTHVWSNADPVTYTNWGTGEPNSPSFDAVFFSSSSTTSGGKWFDSSETSTFQAVIEIVTPPSDSDGDGLTASFDPFQSDKFNGFDLRAAGTDGVFDTADDQVYMLQVTQTSSRVLSFVVQDGPIAAGSYRFTVTPTLTDILGNPLDGNANGVGGDALVRNFTVSAPVPGLFEGKGNRDFSTAVPLNLIQDPLGTGLLRSENNGYGSIDASGDLDYFKFSAQAGDVVAINVDPLVATVPNVFLYDALGNNIASNGRSGPGNTAFISGFALTITGDYYVRIQSGSGNYQVRVDLARGVPMETDYDYSNNSTGGANAVTFITQGTSRLGSIAGAIMAGESGNVDEDYFSLGTVEAGKTILLSVALPQWSTLQPIVEVRNSLGQVISIVTSPTGGVARADISTTGTYYATMLATSGEGPSGQYLLKVAVRATAELDFVDLVVTNAVAPATAGSNDTISVSWTAGNFGAIALNTSNWHDRLFLSSDTTFGNADDVPLGAFTQNRALAVNQTYSNTQDVQLPSGISGNFWVFVQADGFNTVPEFIFDANNVRRSNNPIVVTRNYADLVAAFGTTTPSARRGATINAAWSVTNNGLDSTIAPQWSDALILSIDSTLGNADDRQLALVQHNGVLQKGGSYNANANGIVVPSDVPIGPAFLFIRTDVAGVINENGVLANNTAVVPFTIERDPPVLTLTLDQINVTEGGAITGTVTRNNVDSSTLAVSIIASNSSQFQQPFVVTIGSNQASAQFTLATVNDRIVERDQTVTLTARATDFPDNSKSITVNDDDRPTLSLSLNADEISESGGVAIGRVTRSVVTNQSQRVRLDSSDTTELRTPTVVVIPADAAFVEFFATGQDDLLFDGDQNVTVTALPQYSDGTDIGAGNASRNIKVLDNEVVELAVTINPSEIAESGVATGSVSRTGPIDTALTVLLASNDLSEATVPAQVVIPASQTSTTFAITTIDDSLVDGSQIAVIRADAPSSIGSIGGSASLRVLDASGPNLTVTSLQIPSPLPAGESFDLQVTFRNAGITTAPQGWKYRIVTSSTANLTNPVVLGEFVFGDSLAATASANRTVHVTAPTTLGTLFTGVIADPNDTLDESNNTDNWLAVQREVAQPYRASVSTTVETIAIVPGSTPSIPITGSATLVSDNSPAANRPVSLFISTRGTTRKISLTTNAQGNFAYNFVPFSGEAGAYTISAGFPGAIQGIAQDSFNIVGLGATPTSRTVSLIEGAVASVTSVTLKNISEQALSGLTAQVFSSSISNVSVSLNLGGNSLTPSATTALNVSMNAIDASKTSGQITIRVTAAQGASIDTVFDVEVKGLVPTLSSSKPHLDSTMFRGRQTSVAFDITNIGGRQTGDLQLVLPTGATWLRSANDTILNSMQPGENRTITLILDPTSNLPLGPYSGSIALFNSDTTLTIPFTFTATSDLRGSIRIVAEDDFTITTDNSGLVGAQVKIVDAASNASSFTGTISNSDGSINVPNLTEGFYYVTVSADQHLPVKSLIQVLPSQATELELFLPIQVISYRFDVVPTEIVDVTRITVAATFNTTTPAPVLRLSPSQIDLTSLEFRGAIEQLNITLDNDGLIALDNVTIRLPQHPAYEFRSLVTNIGTIPAGGSVSLPILVKRLTSGIPRVDQYPPQWVYLDADYTYKVQPKNRPSFDVANTARVFLLAAESVNVGSNFAPPVLPGLPPADGTVVTCSGICVGNGGGGGSGGGGAGGAGGGSGGGRPSVDVTFPSIPVPPDSGVPVQVKLKLTTDLIQTRDAFSATLQVINGSTYEMTDFSTNITLLDTHGNVVSNLFGITSPELIGFTGSNGSGRLSSTADGSAKWTIIPSIDASSFAPVTYYVSGSFSYSINGTHFQVPFTPVNIDVHPQPELYLSYYWQRDAVSDDPFTPDQVESAQPVDVVLLVENRGRGMARNLTVQGYQPTIFENNQGLKVDFFIYSTEVNNSGVQADLTASIGELAPGQSAVIRWRLVSSLQGIFNVDPDATTVTHLSSVDDSSRLSLIPEIPRIYNMIHVARDYGTGTDGLLDFLTDEIDQIPSDNYKDDGIPDTIRFSNVGSSSQLVGAFTNAQFSNSPTTGNPVATLSVGVPNAGWNFAKVPFPGIETGIVNWEIASIRRSDGTLLPADNYWITDRTFPPSGGRPTYENMMHIIDKNSTGTYTVTFVVADHTPPVAIIEALRSNPVPIESVDIVFSEPVLRFDIKDLTLTKVGSTSNNLMTGNELLTSSDGGSTWRLSNLRGLNTSLGSYRLALNAVGSSIRDLRGNPLALGVSVQWDVSNEPKVERVKINDGSNSRSQVTSLTVDFSVALDLANLSGAFVLTNMDTGTVVGSVNVAGSTVNGKTSAFLTFSGASTVTRGGTGALGNSLANGNYRLDILADKIRAIDTNAAMNADYVFGGQTANAANNDHFFRLLGDTNGDGVLNGIDLNAIIPSLFNPLGYRMDLDTNGDGVINGIDLNALIPTLFGQGRR